MIYTILIVIFALAFIAGCAYSDYKNGYLSNPFNK